MANIEPTKQKIGLTVKEKGYPGSTRFWHWFNFLIIMGSLSTVLINATLFDHNQGAFVKNELMKAGAVVSDKQATTVIHSLENKVWDFHIYFGYVLVALFIFRIIAEFFLPSSSRLIPKLRKAYCAYFIWKKDRDVAKHELVVKGLYIFFYLLLLIMATTGILLAFGENLGISPSISHSIKEFHGFCMYLVLAFITVHLAGVLLAEHKDGKGIVSDMINGGKL